MTTRVVVTGVGPVSSIGTGPVDFATGLFAGRSGASRIASFDVTGFPHVMAGEVRDFAPTSILTRLDPTAWGRSALFAAAAARLAMTHAGLDDTTLAPDRLGVVFGTTSGESQVIEAVTAQALAGGFDSVPPELFARIPAGRLAEAAAAEIGARAEAITLTTACSASNYAIGYAYDCVVAGEADVMIAGGADSVCRWAHAGFYRLGALAEDVPRPFDANRAGILTAEGGVALVLESLERARARGAHVLAEVLGYGLNCDANHPVAPDESSIAACMRLAHANAGIKAADVDYICAHGTGTTANDLAEARAVREVFGDCPPPMSSVKSMLGHTMGAASGFGAVASVLAIQRGLLPPTINWRTPDPDLWYIDPVPNTARPATVRIVQNNGYAFGGNNAITLFGAVS